MHQIRYFLAVSQLLNFTRAAEECNVTQPSLTRAIKKLEDELGGELFRRERQNTHITELGQVMLPLLRQSYESALSAKSVAGSYNAGDYAPLSLALCKSVDLAPFVAPLSELTRAMHGLMVDFHRLKKPDVLEVLKSGEAELAIAGAFEPGWDRLNAWPLFNEDFVLVVNQNHHLAQRSNIDLTVLAGERVLARNYCDSAEALGEAFGGDERLLRHKMASDEDVLALLEANVGIALLPRNARRSECLRMVEVTGLDMYRTVYLYEVAGRRRSPAASGLMKLLRSCELATAPVGRQVEPA